MLRKLYVLSILLVLCGVALVDEIIPNYPVWNFVRAYPFPCVMGFLLVFGCMNHALRHPEMKTYFNVLFTLAMLGILGIYVAGKRSTHSAQNAMLI